MSAGHAGLRLGQNQEVLVDRAIQDTDVELPAFLNPALSWTVLGRLQFGL
jgi:hypothetical protein